MKTTIELSDALLKAARRKARARGLTLRALVEEGLRRVLKDDPSAEQFRLRSASFGSGGGGRSEELSGWPEQRDLIYKERGG